MTFCAEIGLPFVFDVDRMLKFHQIIDRGVLHFTRRTLCNDRMAHVAVFRYHFTFLTFMTIGVTTETSVRFKVTDVVQVTAGGGPHVWKDIQNKEKAKAIGEDEKFRLKDEMQKLIDVSTKILEEKFVRKEKEIRA